MKLDVQRLVRILLEREIKNPSGTTPSQLDASFCSISHIAGLSNTFASCKLVITVMVHIKLYFCILPHLVNASSLVNDEVNVGEFFS